MMGKVLELSEETYQQFTALAEQQHCTPDELLRLIDRLEALFGRRVSRQKPGPSQVAAHRGASRSAEEMILCRLRFS